MEATECVGVVRCHGPSHRHLQLNALGSGKARINHLRGVAGFLALKKRGERFVLRHFVLNLGTWTPFVAAIGPIK